MTLSKTEMVYLRLLAEGWDNLAIAEKLIVAPRTVKNTVSRIYDKLPHQPGQHLRVEAAMWYRNFVERG